MFSKPGVHHGTTHGRGTPLMTTRNDPEQAGERTVANSRDNTGRAKASRGKKRSLGKLLIIGTGDPGCAAPQNCHSETRGWVRAAQCAGSATAFDKRRSRRTGMVSTGERFRCADL